jgi:MinD-like ATPase involved in chromosome partitioning or flagellar assembly
VIEYCGSLLFVSAHARENMPKVVRKSQVFRSFDEIYGTDTAGSITVENLQIESANRRHGSPYEPMPIRTFEKLIKNVKVRHRDYVFLDLGSGKGRTLLLASNYSFKKVIGVEYALDLHLAALKNIDQYRSHHQRCFSVESVHIDATEYVIPLDPTICFFFNPFNEEIMRTVLTKFKKSLDHHPRDVKFISYIPRHVHLFDELGFSRDQLLLQEATLRDIKESASDRVAVC